MDWYCHPCLGKTNQIKSNHQSPMPSDVFFGGFEIVDVFLDVFAQDFWYILGRGVLLESDESDKICLSFLKEDVATGDLRPASLRCCGDVLQHL